MPKKLTYGFVKEQFEKEGCVLLSLDYKGNRQPLKNLKLLGCLGSKVKKHIMTQNF
jgi:hypothetical protein